MLQYLPLSPIFSVPLSLSLAHPRSRPRTHSYTYLLIHPLAHSLSHAHPPTRARARSLSISLTQELEKSMTIGDDQHQQEHQDHAISVQALRLQLSGDPEVWPPSSSPAFLLSWPFPLSSFLLSSPLPPFLLCCDNDSIYHLQVRICANSPTLLICANSPTHAPPPR